MLPGINSVSDCCIWFKFLIPVPSVSADQRLLVLAVCAHANQARTRTFNWKDPANVRYAADVADFARQIGVYSGSDARFSFSDTYDPVTFEGARFCEARVFSFFSAVAAADVKVVYPRCPPLWLPLWLPLSDCLSECLSPVGCLNRRIAECVCASD